MTEIPKKQHFSDGKLTAAFIPETITSIGDWAFAKCRNLSVVAMPGSVTTMGRCAFADCDNLTHVYCYPIDGSFIGEESVDPSDSEDHRLIDGIIRQYSVSLKLQEMKARLNAISLRYFEAPLSCLLSCEEESTPCADDQQQRLKAWDRQCMACLEKADDADFQPFLAGGEEDYGDEDALRQDHVRRIRLCKANVIFTRLLAAESYPSLSLQQEIKETYLQRFRALDAALSLLATLSDDADAIVRIYKMAGVTTRYNTDQILQHLRPDQIELRAAFIQNTKGDLMDLLSTL